MANKKEVVDLVPIGDGSYAPQEHTVPAKKKPEVKKEKPKYRVNKEVDEFLAGIDVGLDLIDDVAPRLERFFKLRG